MELYKVRVSRGEVSNGVASPCEPEVRKQSDGLPDTSGTPRCCRKRSVKSTNEISPLSGKILTVLANVQILSMCACEFRLVFLLLSYSELELVAMDIRTPASRDSFTIGFRFHPKPGCIV